MFFCFKLQKVQLQNIFLQFVHVETMLNKQQIAEQINLFSLLRLLQQISLVLMLRCHKNDTNTIILLIMSTKNIEDSDSNQAIQRSDQQPDNQQHSQHAKSQEYKEEGSRKQLPFEHQNSNQQKMQNIESKLADLQQNHQNVQEEKENEQHIELQQKQKEDDLDGKQELEPSLNQKDIQEMKSQKSVKQEDERKEQNQINEERQDQEVLQHQNQDQILQQQQQKIDDVDVQKQQQNQEEEFHQQDQNQEGKQHKELQIYIEERQEDQKLENIQNQGLEKSENKKQLSQHSSQKNLNQGQTIKNNQQSAEQNLQQVEDQDSKSKNFEHFDEQQMEFEEQDKENTNEQKKNNEEQNDGQENNQQHQQGQMKSNSKNDSNQIQEKNMNFQDEQQKVQEFHQQKQDQREQYKEEANITQKQQSEKQGSQQESEKEEQVKPQKLQENQVVKKQVQEQYRQQIQVKEDIQLQKEQLKDKQQQEEVVQIIEKPDENEDNNNKEEENPRPICLTEENEHWENTQTNQEEPKQAENVKIIEFQQFSFKHQQDHHSIRNKTQQKKEQQKEQLENSKEQKQKIEKKQIVKEFIHENLQDRNSKQQQQAQVLKDQLKTNQNQEKGSQKYKIYNQSLLKRIQQLEETVNKLKLEKNKVPEMETAIPIALQSQQKEKPKKTKQIIHQPSVHNLVNELSKSQIKNGGSAIKPSLQEKKIRRRKLDLTSLMDKNMVMDSNIFNITIGEILIREKAEDEEKDRLRKEIKQLRERVVKLQEQKKSSLATATITHRANNVSVNSRRESISSGKKDICGRLVRVSEIRNSRVSIEGGDNSEFQFKGGRNFMRNGSRSRKSSVKEQEGQKNLNFSFTQRQANDASNFRVRKPSARTNFGYTAPHFSSSNLDDDRSVDEAPNNYNNDVKVSMFPVTGIQEKKQINQKRESQGKEWWEEPFIATVQLPQMCSPPTQFDSQQDLFTLAKIIFQAFKVPMNPSTQIIVKKYKNCVYFNIGEKSNILWYYDGRFYFGQWQISMTGQGQKSGFGLEYLPGKYIYQGFFKEGKRHGKGTIKILNKEKEVIYEGNWVEGNKNGFGKQFDEHGIKYEGHWKDNKREGFGKLKLPDGDLYQGNFVRGIKTGQGIEYFKNGDKYEGEYLANKFNGKGKYFWKNQSMFEGDFVNGIRSGSGTWISNINSEHFDSYTGEYDRDKKNGFGTYKWADGSEYQGYFKDDLKDGEGTIRYRNGKVAKLLWRNGQPMKKIFSEEEKNYRETMKETHKKKEAQTIINSGQFSLMNLE